MSAAAGCCPGGSKGSMAGSHSEQEMAGSHSGHDMNSMGGGKAAMSKAADAASMDAKRRAYPLDWCVVTGESLGADGEPVEIMHEGRLIRLCCKGCVGKFQRDPAKFLAKLDAAKRGEKVQRPAGSGSAATHGGDDHSGHSH